MNLCNKPCLWPQLGTSDSDTECQLPTSRFDRSHPDLLFLLANGIPCENSVSSSHRDRQAGVVSEGCDSQAQGEGRPIPPSNQQSVSPTLQIQSNASLIPSTHDIDTDKLTHGPRSITKPWCALQEQKQRRTR
jgi:hypothetical protein